MTSAHTGWLGKLCCLRVTVRRWRPPRLTFDGDDELGDDRQDLGSTVLQHVVDPVTGEELVRVNSLTQAVKEHRQVVVVVQLVNLHLRTQMYIYIPGCFIKPLRLRERGWELLMEDLKENTGGDWDVGSSITTFLFTGETLHITQYEESFTLKLILTSHKNAHR